MQRLRLGKKVAPLDQQLADTNRKASALPRLLGWARLLSIVRRRKATHAIVNSGLFDRHWYLENNPDIARAGVDPIQHYLLHGAREGRDPSPSFSSRGYLSQHPDAEAAEINPLEHFI